MYKMEPKKGPKRRQNLVFWRLEAARASPEALRGPLGRQGGPNRGNWEPKGAQREPKGSPKGGQKEPKMDPKIYIKIDEIFN